MAGLARACRICARVPSRGASDLTSLMVRFLVLGKPPNSRSTSYSSRRTSPLRRRSAFVASGPTKPLQKHRSPPVGSTSWSLSVRSGVRSLKGPQAPRPRARVNSEERFSTLTGARRDAPGGLATSRPPSPSEATTRPYWSSRRPDVAKSRPSGRDPAAWRSRSAGQW